MTDPDLRRSHAGKPEPRRTRILRLIGAIGFFAGIFLAVLLTALWPALVGGATFVVSACVDALFDIADEERGTRG